MTWLSIAGEIVQGLVSGIITGINASKEKQAEISARVVVLLRTGADAVEAARAGFASEDAQTIAAFAEKRRQLMNAEKPLPPVVMVSDSGPIPLPPAVDEETDPGKKVPQ